MNIRESLQLDGCYLLDEAAFHTLMNKMRSDWPPRAYSKYTVCDLYLDAAGNKPEIRREAQKAAGETLQLQSFGTPKAGDCIYLERTMQWGSAACKRRVPLTLEEAKQYMEQGNSGQLLREQEYLCHGVAEPQLYLAYEREAYSFSGTDMQLLLDSNLRYRTNALSLLHGDKGERLLQEGTYFLQIKGAIPAAIWQSIHAMRLRPVPFSKYGYAYIAATLKKRRACA